MKSTSQAEAEGRSQSQESTPAAAGLTLALTPAVAASTINMVHVFVLMLYMGDNLISNDMMFYDLSRCNYFAAEMTRTYGNYRYLDRVPADKRRTAFCVPQLVDKDANEIY